jgi:hypothetical protein
MFAALMAVSGTLVTIIVVCIIILLVLAIVRRL